MGRLVRGRKGRVAGKIHEIKIRTGRNTMKNWNLAYLGCAVLFLAAMPLHAQTGCSDSPENPTVVLALVGSAGALFSAVRARARRNSRQR
jgi:XrtJ-associated TM-motif-TM protein